MPVPLIDLQRRLTVVGAIRAGGEKQPRKPGAKLEAFRITSPRRALIEQAAELYGGPISPWKSPTGDEWQVYTEADVLPVLVMPSYSLRQSYELWEGATKRLRVCDGVDEELTGGPCICNAEGEDRCDLYTRLVVALPELDTVLGWKVITRGANAAHELPTMFALIEAQGARTTFVPARLVLDQRRGVKDGTVVRYVVPTLDLGVGYLRLASPPLDGAAGELPPGGGFAPAVRQEPTVGEALGAAAAPSRRRSGRTAAAFGPRPDPPPPTPPPAPSPSYPPPPTPPRIGGAALEEPDPEVEHGNAEPITDDGDYSGPRQTAHLTSAQSTKLDVLVGKLRDTAKAITTEQLWESIAGLRSMDVGLMEKVIAANREERGESPPRTSDGILHWAPLRDSLMRPEAVQLIDWLSIKEHRVATGERQREAPTPPPAEPTRDAEPEQIPFGTTPSGVTQGELPEGY